METLVRLAVVLMVLGAVVGGILLIAALAE